MKETSINDSEIEKAGMKKPTKYEEKILNKIKELGYDNPIIFKNHNTPAVYGASKDNQEVEIWKTEHNDEFTIREKINEEWEVIDRFKI
ncbi:hypothetical protein SATMO3_61820 [Sporomusa aerivorans]